MVIQLYQKGITTREIADIIEKMYGCYYSPQTISNMTKVVDYGIYSNESTLADKERLDYAKQRGLEDILLFIGGGFQGLQQACQEI